MIAARFASSGLKFRPVSGILFRSFNSQPKESFTRRSFRSKFQEAASNANARTVTNTPIAIGQMAAAGASALGLGAMAFYGLGFSNKEGALERSAVWPQYIKDRVSSTYQYFGASIGITAASAWAVANNAPLMRIATSGGLMFMFGSIAALVGSSMLVRSLPYEQGKFNSKNMAWIFHSGLLGGLIAPVSLLGGPIVMKAAMYTAGIVGGLSLIAATAPSEKFLNMGGPLAIGLGVVFASSIGSAFLPPTTKLGLSLYSMSLYGGLILFSMFLLYDTQKIVKKAETQMQFDPINESVGIFMDTVNIFIRMATIFANGGNRRK